MSDRPKWLIEAAVNYHDGRETLSMETNLQRTTRLLRVLKSHVYPSFRGCSQVNVLDVGVGLNAHLIKCPYEPYRIAGDLEHRNLDYQLALVDKDHLPLDDVAHRTKLYLLQDDAGPIYTIQNKYEDLKAWKEYLTHTHQSEIITHEFTDQLYWGSWMTVKDKAKYLERGIREATIPHSFRSKLQSNQIPLVHGDIATLDINSTKYPPYDLIVAQFVFSYLRENGQKLALFNLAQATRKGGYIVIDDPRVIPPWMSLIFKGQTGGWITDEALGEIGLKDSHRYQVSESYSIHVLQKQ